MISIFIPLFIALVVHSKSIEKSQPEVSKVPRCGRNAFWSNCSSYCPPNCESLKNPNPIRCPAICVDGCVCFPGYIRISRTDANCILRRYCPYINEGSTNPTEPTQVCGPNSVWSNCASACLETCTSIRSSELAFCIFECQIGCVCTEGFVQRSRDSEECITYLNC